MEVKKMKIMSKKLTWIPFDLLNEEWAGRNHGQTLDRLNERGGLGLDEALSIIERRKWRFIDEDTAIKAISEHIKKAEILQG